MFPPGFKIKPGDVGRALHAVNERMKADAREVKFRKIIGELVDGPFSYSFDPLDLVLTISFRGRALRISALALRAPDCLEVVSRRVEWELAREAVDQGFVR